MELLAALANEAATALVLEIRVDWDEIEFVDENEGLAEDGLEEEEDEEEAIDAELGVTSLEADEVAAVADCACEALSGGLLDVAVSEGRSLLVACLRSLAGVCSPMLVCTHSPRQARTRIHRLCISVARSGVGCSFAEYPVDINETKACLCQVLRFAVRIMKTEQAVTTALPRRPTLTKKSGPCISSMGYLGSERTSKREA